MREPFDEATLTAYALGELSGPERERVEALLAGSPEMREELSEIRETAATLTSALTSAAPEALDAKRRATVEAEARRRTGARPRWALAATAATLAAAVLWLAVVPLRRPARVAPFDAALTVPPASTLAPRGTVAAPLATQPPFAFTDDTVRLRSLGDTDDGRVARRMPWPAKKVADGFEAYGSPGDQVREQSAPFNTEAYDHIQDNPFILVANDPRSTFSVDVDTASYSIVRRFLNDGQRPPKDAVRIEELVNYFRYDDAPPTGDQPFAVHLETAQCPWTPDHRLVRIALKGRELPRGERPPSNLVFLLDVSGSMDEPRKLPLVKAAMRLLVNELGPRDRVAIVVYAGSEGLALPSTAASEKAAILNALDALTPGGSTHGSAGIRLAYEVAEQGFIKGGINRVILATDGDFNVGVTSQGDLVRLIEAKAKSGVFLTALGFGMGNLKDSTLEKLADHGNGNYAYIDSLNEARKVLVDQIGATLVTIAKDVKLQLEFNPATVKAYRLIGYENRVLPHQDFNDDTKDAGDIGAGHTVTALYEVVPPGASVDARPLDPLKYQARVPPAGGGSNELLHVKLRYKQPDGDRSALLDVPLEDGEHAFDSASEDFRFAAAVASFGMVLRDSPYKGQATMDKALDWARGSLGADEGGLRAELLTLIEKARALTARHQ